MKRIKYKPYNFDSDYEHRTYKHIGHDYGDAKTANKGLIKNVLRWLRRNFLNKGEGRYKFCNTYGEWKQYVKKKFFCSHSENGINMLKFLNVKKRKAAILLEASKTALIPLYIAVFSILPSMFTEEDWKQDDIYIVTSMFIFIVLTIVVAIGLLQKYNHMYNFYHDFMECLDEEESK